MHNPAIELLVLGNTQSEVEAYLTALRNSGKAAHATQVAHDSAALNHALQKQIDLVIYTREPGEIGIRETLEILAGQGQERSLIVLDENANGESKAELLALGVKDLVERSGVPLLIQVIGREYANLLLQREHAAIKQKLIESEEHCNLLTEHSRDPIGYIYEGMHIKANSSYLQRFGLTNSEEIEGLPILDLVAPSNHQEIKQLLRRLNQDIQGDTHLNCSCLRMDGNEFEAELSFLPATIDGEPCFQVTIQWLPAGS
jgi:PAS domain S-box-containing protein